MTLFHHHGHFSGAPLCWVAGLAMLMLAGCGGETNPEPSERRGGDRAAVAVEVAQVEVGPMRDVRSLTGTLRAESRFTIATKVQGQLLELNVDVGDEVEQGAPIAQLEDAESREEVAQAEAELEVAKAQLEEAESALELARRDLDRSEALREGRLVAEADFDAVSARRQAEESKLKVARASILQREATLRRARLRLDYARIEADWTGDNSTRVVAERFVNAGDTLSANTPVISIIQLDPLRASVQVTERDYDRIHEGQAARIVSAALPDREFDGQVTRKAPFFRESSRQAMVELVVDNREHLLKPGMFIRVALELDRLDDAIKIPRSAVVQREGQTGVYLVNRSDDTARFVPVETGFSEGNHVRVLSPEDLEGEVVVVGQDQLTDGMPVRVIDTAPAEGASPPDQTRRD